MRAEGSHGPVPVPGYLFLDSDETSRNLSHFRRMCLEIFRIKGEGSDGHDCYDKKFPDFDCIFQTENWRNN